MSFEKSPSAHPYNPSPSTAANRNSRPLDVVRGQQRRQSFSQSNKDSTTRPLPHSLSHAVYSVHSLWSYHSKSAISLDHRRSNGTSRLTLLLTLLSQQVVSTSSLNHSRSIGILYANATSSSYSASSRSFKESLLYLS